MNSMRRTILTISIIAMCITGAVVIFLKRQHAPQEETYNSIFVYEKKRDYQDIVDLFELERTWLTSTVDYSPYFMLDYMTPNKNPAFRGKLHIHVLRPENKFAGFTAFYMHDARTGMILFLAVRPEVRSRGYGKLLIQSAIKALKTLGAQKINLLTRTTNTPAQRVYERIGFDEILRDDEGYVYYEYTK